MTEFFTLLTSAGLAVFANAALTGSSVNITEVAIGDGDRIPTQALTSLKSEVWRGPVIRLATSANDPTVLECDARIAPDEGGWTVREVGLYNDAGVLLAVGNLPESYKPNLESGSGKDMQIRVSIQHSNASSVTLKIDPAIIMASRAWVYDEILPAYLMGCVNALAIDKINHPQGI